MELDVDDCVFGKDGLTVTLRRSKIDQTGAGRKIGIPYGSNPETYPVHQCRRGSSKRDDIGRARPAQAGVPVDPAARAGSAGPVVEGAHRHDQRACGEETGTTGRAGCREVCRAFAAGRARHQCRHCGSFRTLDHEPDGASVGSDQFESATSGTVVCSGRTARERWDCDGGAARPQKGRVRLSVRRRTRPRPAWGCERRPGESREASQQL